MMSQEAPSQRLCCGTSVRPHRDSCCMQEACATNFEYFASDYASAALQGVGTYFYPTAELLPFRDDFAGIGEHPISDPSNAGEFINSH